MLIPKSVVRREERHYPFFVLPEAAKQMKHSNQPVVLKRFPVSVLSDIAYFTQPMPRQLAETIRTLRRDHGLSHVDVMWALSESEPDLGQCYGFGKAFTERARIECNDNNPNWT